MTFKNLILCILSRCKQQQNGISFGILNIHCRWLDIPDRFGVLLISQSIHMPLNIKSEIISFKSNENIHKKEGGSFYIQTSSKFPLYAYCLSILATSYSVSSILCDIFSLVCLQLVLLPSEMLLMFTLS